MYKEVEGDLISLFKQGEFDVIVHGCNCFNIMGAGIAKTLSNEYPNLLKVDEEFPIPVGTTMRLGNYSSHFFKDDKGEYKWIINAYTQFNPGQNLDYNALELVMKKINFNFRPERIGLPLIGCGIAGGDWKVVKKIIQRQFKDCDVTVVKYNTTKH